MEPSIDNNNISTDTVVHVIMFIIAIVGGFRLKRKAASKPSRRGGVAKSISKFFTPGYRKDVF